MKLGIFLNVLYVFFILSIISISNSFAKSSTSSPVKAPLSKERPCGFELSRLNIGNGTFDEVVEQNGIVKKAFCIEARSDNQAHCGSGFTPINPGNPNYGVKPKSSTNDRSINDLGFYFCVPSEVSTFGGRLENRNSKEWLCRNTLRLAISGLRYEWFPTSEKDGDCKCAPVSANGTIAENDWQLQCDDPNDLALRVTNISDINLAMPGYSLEQTEDQPQVTNTQTFRQCLANVRATGDSCKRQGEAASQACDPNSAEARAQNEDGNPSTTQTIAGLVAGVAQSKVAANAGSGAQATCFTAGLAANGARSLTESKLDSCTSAAESCNNNCGESRYNQLLSDCASQNGLTVAQLDSGAVTSSPDNLAAYQEIIVTPNVRSLFEQGETTCQQGRAKISQLEQLLSGVGNALQQSMTCACQLSGTSGATTSSIGGCNNIPNPATCENNPSIAGCELYAQMSVCTPGASYNAELCRCQTNPKAAGCPGTKTDTMLSSFAGGAIKAGAVAGPTGFGMPAGFQSSGNTGDLGTGADPSNAGVISTGKAAGLGNVLPSVTGGGGGSSGGGGSGGGEKNNVAAVDREEKGLFGGILSAGRFIGNALGIKSKKADGGVLAAKKNANAKKTPRGLAGSKAFAGKHVTIWELMNKCVQGETCQSNVGQFIVEPEK